MSEEEKEQNKEETPVEETAPEETPVEETRAAEPVAEEAPAEDAPAGEDSAEPDPLGELPWKERRRILKSRASNTAGPALTGEERDARRVEERKKTAAQRRKRRAGEKSEATKGPGAGTPVPDKVRTGKPKERQGLVTSNKADKTITVQIDSARRHPVYEKIVRQRHKIHVHDPQNEAGEGDLVRVIETRKLSRTKHWRLLEVIEKAR